MQWVILSIMGAILQPGRNALQKSLKPYVNDWVVTWTRFFFGLPFVVLIYWVGCNGIRIEWSLPFILYSVLGGVSHMVATRSLMGCFSGHQFASGMTFIKLEIIFTALIGLVVFKESVTVIGGCLIGVGFVGIALVSMGKNKLKLSDIIRSFGTPESIYGVICGVFYAFAGVLFRQANLALPYVSSIDRGVVTLLVVIAIQTILLSVFLLLKYPNDLKKIKDHIPTAVSIGVLSVICTTCWFIAFGLINVAYVKLIGQVDIIIAILIGVYWFKERLTRTEAAGLVLVIVSVSLIGLQSTFNQENIDPYLLKPSPDQIEDQIEVQIGAGEIEIGEIGAGAMVPEQESSQQNHKGV